MSKAIQNQRGVFIGIRIPIFTKRRLDSLCKRTGLKKSAFLLGAIECALDRAEKHGIRLAAEEVEA